MKGFQPIPPPQRHMTLSQIHQAHGTRGVVAYSCTMDGTVPTGGYVVAVQDGPSARNLKEYLRQFKQKFPVKEPVYYLKVAKSPNGPHFALIYDNGTGEKQALPKIETKQSEPERLISLIPDDILAQMIKSAFVDKS